MNRVLTVAAVILTIVFTAGCQFIPAQSEFYAAKGQPGLCIDKAEYYAQSLQAAGHTPYLAIVPHSDTEAHMLVTLDKETFYDPTKSIIVQRPKQIHIIYEYRVNFNHKQ